MSIPFSKRHNSENDDGNDIDKIDDKALQKIKKMTVDQLLQDVNKLTQEFSNIESEYQNITEKSRNLELVVRSQQKSISLLNSDNQKIMNVLSQKRKTKKKHREIDLNQINHQTFEKQKMISSSSQKKAENDQNLRMIHNLRENIFKESKEKLFSFPLLNDRRNNLICRFKNYQEYLQNRKKFVEIRGNIDDQIKLNKEMTEELQKRREIRKEFEKMKEELAKINKEKEIVDDIVNDIQIKVNEINKIKSLSKVQKMHYFDSLFNINIDAQNTQELSQYFHSDDSLCNAEVLTDSPLIFEMNDNSMRNFIKDLENQIKEIEKSISEQKVQVVLLLQKLKEQEQRKLKEFDKTLQYIQGKLI